MPTFTVDTTLAERPTVYGNATNASSVTGYNVAEILMPNIATAAGSGAGATVTTSIVFGGNLPQDTNYTVRGTASQACALSYTSKTTSGFNIVQTPLSGGATLSSGTIDLNVSWPNGVSAST